MERNTREIGTMENNMERELYMLLGKLQEEDYGKRVNW